MDEPQSNPKDFFEHAFRTPDHWEVPVRAMMAEFSTVEEYAARKGRLILMCSYGLGVYTDPKVGDWIRRLMEIIGSEVELSACEEMFLTAYELVENRKPMEFDL